MSALVFLSPQAWPLLLLVPLSVGGLWLLALRHERWLHAELGPRGRALVGRARRPLLRGCAVGAWALLLVVALLRPVGVGSEGEDGADVVLVLDVSWSMAARDLAPSRLAACQRAIEVLAAAAPASRLALVAFAGDASLQVPLTSDGAALVAMANELLPGALGRPGTDPGAAIDLAAAQLSRAGRPGAIFVCSDGEDFVGGGAMAAARALAAGHAVHGFGCGDPTGSKIPVDLGDRETFLRDADGRDIVSARLDEPMAAMAAAGGGVYTELAPEALRGIHERHVLPAARAAAVRAGRLQPLPWQQWPLLAALLFWMLLLCQRERVR